MVRRFQTSAVFASVVFALCLAVLVTSGVADARMDRPGNVPTVADAAARVTTATDALAASRSQVEALEAEQSSLESQRLSLSEQQVDTLQLLEQSSRDAREFMLTAYIGGGDVADSDYLLSSDNAGDVSWRWYLVADRAALSRRSLDRYQALRLTSDEQLVLMASRANEVRAHLREVRLDVERLETQLRNEEQWLLIATAWAESDLAVAEGPFGEAPQSAWDQLRFCESTNNYAALSPSGLYRGAYQFDRATWATVGGTGDPAAAPPLEQDARARILYARRGKTNTWPVCGRYLP